MTMKKILCLVLALVLCGAMAFAEEDLQTQLDAANARIAELEGEVERYKPYYDAQVIAEFAGGIVFLDDVMEEYEYTQSMYADYGIDLVAYGYDTQIKQMIVQGMVRDAVCKLKAAELGLDQLDEETLNGLKETGTSNFEAYVTSVSESMLESGYSEDTVRDEAVKYLEQMGYTQEALTDDLVANYVSEQLYKHVTADVTVSEEDVQATYDELVAKDQETYAQDSSFTNAFNSETNILWYPEGYRTVKHVLVKFDDAQSTRYTDLSKLVSDLTAELDAVKNPSEDADAETEPRTEEEINADLTAAQADLDALYAELLPKAQEVIDKFNDGTSFDELIDAYNEDPGMNDATIRAKGYALTEGSSYDPAFLAAALALENVGDISEPVNSSFGVHVIYYNSDIVSGAIALDTVHDYVEQTALDNKLSATYEEAVASWIDAAAPTYHYDRIAG